jgi:hypothetical protein
VLRNEDVLRDVDEKLGLLEGFDLKLLRHGRNDLRERRAEVSYEQGEGSRAKRTLFAEGVMLVLKMMIPRWIFCSSRMVMNLRKQLNVSSIIDREQGEQRASELTSSSS